MIQIFLQQQIDWIQIFIKNIYNQMGQFLTILSRQKKSRAQLQFFHNNTLSKINEFYEQYKEVSDTLAIDDSQFTQIFGNHQDIFQILDTDKNLLIDGLQLFTGLILYSKVINFQDKITFLFNLFDFNNQKSLFSNDIQFMLLSCCTFSHKMYALKSQMNQMWIEQFVRSQFFNGQNRINISQILKWANQSAIVTMFFQEILEKPIKVIKTNQQQKLYLQIPIQNKKTSKSVHTQILYLEHLMMVKKHFLPFHQEKNNLISQCQIICEPNWIYGIRIKDVKQFVEIIQDVYQNLHILYFIGKVVIIYQVQAESQRYYREHKNKIVSITKWKNIIASGQEHQTNPLIKVWDFNTLQTIATIKPCHKKGIHLLNFFNEGSFLISCGSQYRGTIQIHNIKTNEVVATTLCDTPIIDVSRIFNFTNYEVNQLIMVGLYEIYKFQVNQKQTNNQQSVKCTILHINNQIYQQYSKITCSAYVQTNRNYTYLKSYDENYLKHTVTGHLNGEVNVWNSDFQTFEFQFTKEKYQIIKICFTSQFFIILTDSSYISFWDINLQKKEKKKVIDITEVPFRLSNYNLIQVIPIQGPQYISHLLITSKGDFFILGKQQDPKQLIRFTLTEKQYQYINLSKIYPMDLQIYSSHHILRQHRTQQLYFAGSTGVIQCIDCKSHQKKTEWVIGCPIISFDIRQNKNQGKIIVAATNTNQVYVKVGIFESNQKIQIKQQITFLLLSLDSNFMIVSTVEQNQYSLMIFSLSSKFIFNFIKTISIQERIVFMTNLQKRMILAIGEKNQVYLISLKDYHIKQLDKTDKNFSNSIVQLVYYSRQSKQKLPIILGAESKFIAMGKSNGDIHMWKGVQQLQERNKITLILHSNCCSNLILNESQKKLFSIGSDHCISEWKTSFFIEQKSALTSTLTKIVPIQSQEDDFIQRQINFCTFKNNILNQLYDQHLLVRGINSNNETLSKLFKGMAHQWKLINQYAKIQEQPAIHFKFDYVFGIEVFNKVDSVISLQNKRFAYFISRVVVIFDPNINKQQIYEAHKFKVTCICLLQDKQHIASGQSAFKPQIHIWNIKSLQTVRIIETIHRWGIILLSAQKDMILSYGIKSIQPSQIFSLQLTNYKKNQLVSSLTIRNPVYCMKINPNNLNQIAISQSGSISFWEAKCGVFYKKTVCYMDEQTPTTMMFYPINKNKMELLIGTKKGTIGVVTSKKYFCAIKYKAHEMRINCLVMLKKEKQKIFVSSSQDQTLKIWSSKFNLIYYQDNKKGEFQQNFKGIYQKKTSDNFIQRNRSIQSISLFQSNMNSPSLLLSMRNGDILQLVDNSQFSYEEPFHDPKHILYLKNNVSQSSLIEHKKILISHNPKHDIIVTVGQDQNLLFWDTDRNRFIFSKFLGYSSVPTAIKFSKEGDYLIIGYSDGLLIFLDSKISKSLQGKTDQKFVMPTLTLIKKQKSQEGNAIVNIQFSDSGQYLAVSFNYKILTSKDKKNAISNSYISLFNNKNKQKIKNFSKLDSGKIFQKFSSISCPYGQNLFVTQKQNKYGMAAHSMVFGQGQGKLYLLIYYQLIDANLNKMNFSNDGKYNVWDVNTSTMIANLDLIASLNWKKFCFQNSIYCKYKFYKDLTSKAIQQIQEQVPINNNLFIPHMSAMASIPNHLILGSINGDIHIVRISALQFQNITPALKDMFIAKTYSTHCSEINHIEINFQKNAFFSTAILDQCIFKYKIEGSTKILQEQVNQISQNDIFGQIPSQELHQQFMEHYRKKDNIQSRVFYDANFIDRIKIVDIIGRKSFNLRNNLMYDAEGRIIYHIGHSVVCSQKQSKNKDFLFVDDDEHNQYHDITRILTDSTHRFIYTLHGGLKIAIVMWDATSKTKIKQILLNQFHYIVYSDINDTGERLVLYALDSNLKGHLILVDLISQKVLGIVSYTHKPTWIIKGICFAHQSLNTFYTCGVQSVKKWFYSGNKISYQQFHTDKNQKVLQLSLTIVQGVLITGGQDGFVYVWKNQILKKHEHDEMVVCLASQRLQNKSNFVSGSKDGVIVVWNLQQNYLTALKKISLNSLNSQLLKVGTKPQTSKKTFNNYSVQIQSLHMYKSQILIGTRSGSVFQSNYLKKSKKMSDNQLVQKIYHFHQQEITQAFFVNFQQTQLYQITKNGLLSIWNIQQKKLLFSQNFFDQVVDMIYHFKNDFVFIVFKKQLKVYKIEKINLTYKIEEVSDLQISVKYITHIQISKNQRLVAIAIEKNSDKSIELHVYQIPLKDYSNGFCLLLEIPLSSPINLFDFSVNNKYMLIKTMEGFIVRDLYESKNVISQIMSKIEWNSNGLIFSKQSEVSINEFYNKFGKCNITKIINLQNERFVIIDQYGGIFVMYNKELISKCSLNMTNVDKAIISKSKKYLVVNCQLDREIVILNLQKCLRKIT